MYWVVIYIASIVAVNVGFVYVPLIDLGPLGMWPPMSLAVGLIFVVRDFAQRRVGHWVLPAMAVGIGLSYFMANPYVAVASATAFAVSELADWLVYTATKKPFAQRVVLSSAVGTPLDSAIFLGMIGHLSVVGVIVMTLSKMIAALVVWRFLRAEPFGGQRE